MALKSEIALGIVNSIATQAVNHAPGNALRAALVGGKGTPGKRLEARIELGQDPNAEEIEPLYNALSTAIDAHNAAVVISKPTLEEVAAQIAAGDSALS